MKKIEINFKDEALKEYINLKDYVKQNKTSRNKPTYFQLLNSIEKTLTLIEINPYHGNLIPKKYLNKNLIKIYGTDKIYREELIGYWRLIYTLIGNEIKIVAIILDFMNHNDYNNLFGYKKR